MNPKEIQSLRHKLGENTKTFGQRLGVSGRTIEDWEQGRSKPSGPAIKLMEIYGGNYEDQRIDSRIARNSKLSR
jgi:putative transcriptional regulator